jgi:AhpD family alkylhydroperoxidase
MDVSQSTPAGFQAVWDLEQRVSRRVDPTVLKLVKLRASMVNECHYCVDLHSRDALAAGESTRRLFAVAAWRDSSFFDDRERAALALTDAVTRLGEGGVPDDVWEGVRSVWSEEETADLLLAVATINLWNRILVTTRLQPPVE